MQWKDWISYRLERHPLKHIINILYAIWSRDTVLQLGVIFQFLSYLLSFSRQSDTWCSWHKYLKLLTFFIIRTNPQVLLKCANPFIYIYIVCIKWQACPDCHRLSACRVSRVCAVSLWFGMSCGWLLINYYV